jgi:putative oxidoreductase
MFKDSTYPAVIGRILIAALFLIFGFQKFGAPAGTQGYIAAHGLPVPALAYAVAVAVEIGGSVLLVVGYKTRPVALIMAVFTAATALFFHNNLADQGQMTQFLKNFAITGGLLQVAAFGGGRFSLDARLDRTGATARATV